MRKLLGRLKQAVKNDPKFPVKANHIERSAILSAEDDISRPSDRLFDLAADCIGFARSISMASVSSRMGNTARWPDVWPGEHYKLLAAMMLALKPKTVIELGTFQGLSSLAMLQTLPAGSKIFTFDVFPWQQIPGTFLQKEDFESGQLIPIVADISQPQAARTHANILREADFIFLDGPKDGAFERVVMERFREIGLLRKPILMFDDTRLWNMLDIWRNISSPKLDMTSFGHWSGTGLVDWTA